MVPPVGVEPTHTASEAVALSTELRGHHLNYSNRRELLCQFENLLDYLVHRFKIIQFL